LVKTDEERKRYNNERARKWRKENRDKHNANARKLYQKKHTKKQTNL